MELKVLVLDMKREEEREEEEEEEEVASGVYQRKIRYARNTFLSFLILFSFL